MDSRPNSAAGPFAHPPEHREQLMQKLEVQYRSIVTLRPVIDAKSRAIAENQREGFKTSLAQELARVKLLNNKQSRKDKGTDSAAQNALAEYRSKSVLSTLSKAKPWLASSDDRGVSLFNCSEGYRARGAETLDMLPIKNEDVNYTGSPVIRPYEPPSPPPADENGRRVFQTGGPTPSFSGSRASYASSSPRRSASSTRPPSAASTAFLAASALSHTSSPSRPSSSKLGFTSFSSSRPQTASSVVSSRAPFGGWADVPTRPLSSKQGFITAEQAIGMEILQRRRCEVLGRNMWRLGKNERSTIAPKGKMEGGNSDFARELKRSHESKERNIAMLEGLFRWMYLLDEKCSAVFAGSATDTWEQISKIAETHNEIVNLKCEKCKLHLIDACEGRLGWKHPDPPFAVPADHPCRYDFLLDWVGGENRSRTALYSSLSKQWRDAVDGRKSICMWPNDNLEWIARIVSWLFDSFPHLPTQELDHELTDRMVIKMFDAFPSAPTKARLVAMAVFLDTCGLGPFMPQEMREALQQNIHSESGVQDDEALAIARSSMKAARCSSAVESSTLEVTTDSPTMASSLSKKEEELKDAKAECKDELTQMYKTVTSVGLKEEAVSKAIYGNILQMHSWSRENESLFAGTDVGVVLNKVMQAFVAATRASKSILVVGMSRLNKKLALLKQQHQQLKLRLQSVKEEASQATQKQAQMLADRPDPSQNISTPVQNGLKRRESRLLLSRDPSMQELDQTLGPSESFSPDMLRGSAFARFPSLRGTPPLGSPKDDFSSISHSPSGRSRRLSQVLRDSAGRTVTDSPEIFEIPDLAKEEKAPSPPPVEQSRARRTTMDLSKAISNAVLKSSSGQLEALMDNYQSSKLQNTYSDLLDDFQEDREHLSVMFRKAVIDNRKKRSAPGANPISVFKTKITAPDVVALMTALGEPVKLAQVAAFLQPSGFNAAMGPSITFDDFFGWWCYYHRKITGEESTGALTSRSQ